jgi:hypothetical protein
MEIIFFNTEHIYMSTVINLCLFDILDCLFLSNIVNNKISPLNSRECILIFIPVISLILYNIMQQNACYLTCISYYTRVAKWNSEMYIIIHRILFIPWTSRTFTITIA